MEETLERMVWHALYELEKYVMNTLAIAIKYRRIGLNNPHDPRRLQKIEVGLVSRVNPSRNLIAC